MVSLRELVSYLDSALETDKFRDYCPNGLQIEGRAEVRRLVAGVTASQALVDAAASAGADALLVHHGYFWKGEDAALTGLKRQRIATLLRHDISLLAYHLPLDAHPEFGNNAELGRRLGFEMRGQFGPHLQPQIGLFGELPEAATGQALARHIGQVLGREPVYVAAGSHPIRTVGWCTGAAQGYIEHAARLGLDAYISGEISEQTVHIARETGTHFFAAGHHATERYGAEALGRHLSHHFSLEFEFIDIDNPA